MEEISYNASSDPARSNITIDAEYKHLDALVADEDLPFYLQATRP